MYNFTLPKKLRDGLRQLPPLRWAKSVFDLKFFQWRRDRRFGTPIRSEAYRFTDWEGNLESEISYWKGVLVLPSMNELLNPNKPLQKELSELLDKCVSPAAEALIIDVGSGPLTIVGCNWVQRLRVIALDPLADHYNMIMNEIGMEPLVRPVKGSGEDLLSFIEPDSVDLLVMNNALDHSFHPIQVVMNMVAAARPGGFVYLSHFANEAEVEDYQGLHQWNIFKRGNDTIIANLIAEYSLESVLYGKALVSTRTKLIGHGVVETIIRKL